MTLARLGALLVFFSALISSPALAEDGGPAGLLPFGGPQAAKLRQRVQNRLKAADVEMIPLKRVSAVSRKTKSNAARARRLGASALIRARVRKSGDRWIADVEVRNDQGKRVRKFRRASSTINRLGNRITAKLLDTGLLPIAGAQKDQPPQVKAGIKKLDDVPADTQMVPPAAAPDQPKLVIRPYKGRSAGRVRTATVRALRDRPVALVPNRQFAEEAKRLNARLGTDDGHVLPARSLGVSGVFEADVASEDGIWSAYIRLVDGDSAKVLAQNYYEGDTVEELSANVQKNLWSDFRTQIQRLEPREAVPVAKAPEAPTADEEPEPGLTGAAARRARRRAEKKPAAVDIEFGVRFEHRNFGYNDAQDDLRDYTLGFGPGIGLRFQWYPGAHFTGGVGSQFGVDFDFKRLFDFDSTRDGLSFPTRSQEFLIGARWRYPIKIWEPAVVAGFGVQKFELEAADPPAEPEVPGVRYRFFRLGAALRVEVGAGFVVTVNGAYRFVFSAGGIESEIWFPNADVGGFDLGLGLAYQLPLGFEIRVATDYRRYFFDLNPVPPDPPFVAGGALDQYWGLSVGVAWRR